MEVFVGCVGRSEFLLVCVVCHYPSIRHEINLRISLGDERRLVCEIHPLLRGPSRETGHGPVRSMFGPWGPNLDLDIPDGDLHLNVRLRSTKSGAGSEPFRQVKIFTTLH